MTDHPEPEPFARPFRLRHHDGRLTHGVLFPDGPAAVLDGPDVGVSAARDLDTLLINYGRAQLEWPAAPENSP
ncbi:MULTISPECIES: hypothetical protein [unclassified Streptomyces]|uniref:hypothetical protein n=1 Tax=unclassified Streptomyces TaxID=2593676 RepID=UPI003420000F